MSSEEAIEEEAAHPLPLDVKLVPTADQLASTPAEDEEEDEEREYSEEEAREDPIVDAFLTMQDALAVIVGEESRKGLTYEEFDACRTLILMGMTQENVLIFADKIPGFQEKRILAAVQQRMKMQGTTVPTHLQDEVATEPTRPHLPEWGR